MEENKLETIKQQQWFYEFTLPDGTITQSYLPDFVRPVHYTREKALRLFLDEYCKKDTTVSALDISCHEGYYTHVLAKYFREVTGIDKNESSLDKAKLITEALGFNNISYVHAAVEQWNGHQPADFVLCFGLLYHIENPVEIFRKLSELTGSAICIESQVLPLNTSLRVEDGCFKKQRDISGTFGLCMDYPELKEGGLTELALVPSCDALISLLKYFGFINITLYQPEEGDYEQFVRGHRVIIYAEKRK